MKKLTTNEFIYKANLIHNNKYNYSKSEYQGDKNKIEIICSEHGVFKQSPHNHLKGYGCVECGFKIKYRLSIENFISRSNQIHNDKYDYSLVEYDTVNEMIDIICPMHGKFSQLASGHLSGRGCPKCKMSKGEKIIIEFLINKNIEFNSQHKFYDCINKGTKRKLPFDFFIPSLNMCIEFDGQQHFKTNNYFKHEPLEKRQGRDKIKTDYCIKNKINLLRIKYNENIIEKLNSILQILIY